MTPTGNIEELSGKAVRHRSRKPKPGPFVSRYVGNDVYGIFGSEFGWVPESYPKLSDRILDTVRRTGGWGGLQVNHRWGFPLVQKRFFEVYAAWTAVEQVVVRKLLTEMPQLQLVAKATDLLETEIQPKPVRQQVMTRRCPNRL